MNKLKLKVIALILGTSMALSQMPYHVFAAATEEENLLENASKIVLEGEKEKNITTGSSIASKVEEINTLNLVNVALGKPATSKESLYTNLDALTDGFKTPVGDAGITAHYKEIGADGADGFNNGHKASWVQIDLEQEYPIEMINIGRMLYRQGGYYIKYFGIVVQLSNDPNFETDIVTVYNNDNRNYAGQGVGIDPTFEELEQGQTINVMDKNSGNPVNARYIRVWSRGHTWNRNSDEAGYSAGNFFREIEVYASSDDPALQPVQKNIASWCGKPTASGKGFESIEEVNGERRKKDGAYKLVDNNTDEAVTHNSTQKQFIQFDYINEYDVKEIRIYRPIGVYNNVQVAIGSIPTSEGRVVYNEIGTYEVIDENVPQVITFDTPVSGSNIRITSENLQSYPMTFSEIEVDAIFANESIAKRLEDRETKTYTYNPNPSYSKYQDLVWEDDFDTLDESKWTVIDGMQNYATIYDRSALDIVVDSNGESYLNLKSDYVGPREDSSDSNYVQWTSGRVESKNKFSFLYGRVDVRAKVPDSQGIWPAIWMLSQDEKGHDEIDILEYLGQDKYDLWTTNHFGVFGIDKASHGVKTVTSRPLSHDFHVYSVEWSPEEIIFYFDGTEVFRTSTAKDSKQGMHPRPMFVILETQVGGGWVGSVDKTGNNTKQKNDYLIDWVKVYQNNKEAKDIYFDDLEYLDGPSDKNLPELQRNPYYTSIYKHSENLQINTENPELYFYGGQPKMEKSRLMLTEQGKNTGEEYAMYKIDGVKNAHFTTYYSVDPGVVGGTYQYKQGKSKLNSENELKFFYSHTEEGPWIPINAKRWDIQADFTEKRPGEQDYPRAEECNYSRHIFDLLDIPEGNSYIKVQFPVAGDMWDEIQIAKAAFEAKSNNK